MRCPTLELSGKQRRGCERRGRERACAVGVPPMRRAGHGLWLLRHDGKVVTCSLFRPPFERHPSPSKAFDSRGQGHTSLGRASPNVAGDIHCVRVVIATTGDRTYVRPSFENEPHGRAAGWAKLNNHLLAAAVGQMFVFLKRTVVELHRRQREDGLSIERRACHTLAERAVAGEGAQRRLSRGEPDFAAQATAFKND